MESDRAIAGCSALSTPSRVKLLQLLAKAGKKGMLPGVIAKELGILPNTVSTQLLLLLNAGLVSSERIGRNIVYRANLGAIKELIGFLTHDCAAGRVVATVRINA
jgi:DNA-binding transcriptional ArsR family regulator